jgi:integrase/recombinase XerD
MTIKRTRLTTRKQIISTEESTLFNYTFEQAFHYFISAKKSEDLRQKTLKSYEEHFNFFHKWMEKNYPDLNLVNELTTSILREYLVYMKEDHFNYKTKQMGLATQTINARIRFLKNFYNLLIKEELAAHNPTEQVNFLRTDESSFQPLTEEEMKRLLNVPDKTQFPQWRDFCLMLLLYDTGMRINEAVNLKVDEIDIKARRIVLPATRSKTRKTRLIPISNHVIKLLLELINENQSHFNNEYVFLNWYGEQMAEDTFRRNLKRYVKKAGITKQFSCHDWRRQSITEMLASGASLFAVQAIVGHSSISSTRRYVKFDEQVIRNQHELYSPVVKMRKKFRR